MKISFTQLSGSKYVLIITLACSLLAIAFTKKKKANTRIMHVQSFTVPRAELDSFCYYIDSFAFPRRKANPFVLSYRLATHHYGPAEPNVWIFYEFTSLADLERAEVWSARYDSLQYPEQSLRRLAYENAYDNYFFPYWQHHNDVLLSLDEKRIKFSPVD